MSAQGGAGWPALGVWLCLSVACTGAYDRPLPVEFVPGEFVVVQTEAAVELYRVEANGEFLARGKRGSVSEAAFDGASGATLWRLRSKDLRWYDPELDDFFEPSVDDMLEELSAEREASCECPHLVFPTLIPLAPGASCPVPPGMAQSYRWVDGEWTSVSEAEPRLFLRRSTSEVSCIEKVSLDDLIAGPSELPPEPRVISLEAYTATTGVMRGLLQHGQFLYVVGDRGWIALDVETLEVRPEHGGWNPAHWPGGVAAVDWIRSSRSAGVILLPVTERQVQGVALWSPKPDQAWLSVRSITGAPAPLDFVQSLNSREFLVKAGDELRYFRQVYDPNGGEFYPYEWEAVEAGFGCASCASEAISGVSRGAVGLLLEFESGAYLVPAVGEDRGQVVHVRLTKGLSLTGVASCLARGVVGPSADVLVVGGLDETAAERVGSREGFEVALAGTRQVAVPCADQERVPLLIGSRDALVAVGDEGWAWSVGSEACAQVVAATAGATSRVDDLTLPRAGGAVAVILLSTGEVLEYVLQYKDWKENRGL